MADKISAFWLEENWNSSVNSREFNIIEKIFPERIAKLRSIYSEKTTQFSGQYPNNENRNFNELKLSGSSPEEILKQAENFSSYRNELYSLAIEKFLKRGDVETAVNLIKDKFNKNMADYKISAIYSNLALETFCKGDLKFSDSVD